MMIMQMLRVSPVTRNLLMLNILVFVVELLLPTASAQRFQDLFALHYYQSPGFRVWQPLTYMFMHGNFTHLFFNMFALFMFGPELEWRLGRRRFLLFYMVCGVGAALVQEGVYAVMLIKYHSAFGPDLYNFIVDGSWRAAHGHIVPLTAEQAPLVNSVMGMEMAQLVNGATVGASGAIFGLLLAFAMLYPNRAMYVMFIPIPVKAKWIVAVYALIELACGVGGFASNVAHFAHLGGMVFGLMLLLYWRRKGSTINNQYDN